MKIVTSDQMRSIDRRAIEEFGIPDLVLMENAGTQVAEVFLERYPDADPEGVLILCGRGNNAGDGLVLARNLLARGLHPRVVLLYPRASYKGNAEHQLQLLERIGGEIVEISAPEAWAEFRRELAGFEVIVDAVLGTGLTKPAESFFEQVFLDANATSAEILSIDIPSGLSGNTAEIPGPAIQADATVALACPKIPHVFPPAEELVGEVYVADIGIPAPCVEAEGVKLNLIDEDSLEGLLTPRERQAHKGIFGHILVIAGSAGKPGAARMVAAGALRAGAGLVTTATPQSATGVVGFQLMEMMTEALPETREGTLSTKAIPRVHKLQEEKTVLTVGPGLSLATETQAAVREIVAKTTLPVILDADGINAFASHPEDLFGKDRPVLLTPHPGEMGRLLKMSAAEVQADRVGICRSFAQEHRCFLVLKGYRTLIGTPEGDVYVNPTGNPGMATGGSGDVLTGVLSGLVGQGLSMLDAARLGVYVHGLAGDLAAEKIGELSLMAGDILKYLPEAFRRLAE
ncbi:MAG: NAD(P)H-hydrate dehydratase [Acidobacteria bacterium]|nr:NAD(P)H-hydrate dehydratase [Acidobacteriota bacterium]